jgi:hypothetical protein
MTFKLNKTREGYTLNLSEETLTKLIDSVSDTRLTNELAKFKRLEEAQSKYLQCLLECNGLTAVQTFRKR